MSRDVAIAKLREGVKAGTISIDACNFDAARIAICCQAGRAATSGHTHGVIGISAAARPILREHVARAWHDRRRCR